MLIDGRSHKVFNFKDINSLISFEDWLKRSLSIYPEDSNIPESDLLDLLNYIREKVYSQKVENKREWLEQLDSLVKRVSKQ
tara:strand:- start:718 stop:960 length:243 start_codon:yes stop_codon:yes gene_type:complete